MDLYHKRVSLGAGGAVFALMLCLSAGALCAWGAPVASAVAEGYADWSGVEPKNRIIGRNLSASDFRQRVTIFVLLPCDPKDEKSKKLGDVLRETGEIGYLQSLVEWAFDWEREEKIPREVLLIGLLQGKCTRRMLTKALEPRKDEDALSNPASGWCNASFYLDVAMINGPDPAGQLPYAYVMGPNGIEPLWKGVYKKGDSRKEIAAAVKKAKCALPEWTPLTGLSEPQFFAKERQELLAGKPVQAVVAKLAKSFRDKDPEKAKEAQIMYDAVFQYRSDLLFRIEQEMQKCPARAFVDARRLFALFPQEKKRLQEVSAKMKASKSLPTVGKALEKVLEWNRPDFVFKNTAEAKKAVQLVETWRKPLEKISNDQTDAGLAGEASIILAQLDGLSDALLSKIPQK